MQRFREPQQDAGDAGKSDWSSADVGVEETKTEEPQLSREEQAAADEAQVQATLKQMRKEGLLGELRDQRKQIRRSSCCRIFR